MRFRFVHDDVSAVAELDPTFDTFPGIERIGSSLDGFFERHGVDDDGTRVYRWAAASAADRFAPPEADGG